MTDHASPDDRRDERRGLYPEIEPYHTGRLRVSDLHELYFELVGNPDGKPAVFLHGGPGVGIEPMNRRYFDPTSYNMVLFDQRGCGQSTPHASLTDNTTGALVSDIENLRRHLGIERWLVFGGSWGSTLALAYAETHPAQVSELVLRGVFLLRRDELQWFYQEGASHIFPDEWQKFTAPIPETERGDLIAAYYKRLTSDNKMARMSAARAWSTWEAATLSLLPDPDRIVNFAGDHFAEAFSRIECHYFVNGAFFATDAQLLEKVGAIRHIPAVIVQGRYDVVTPMRSAWDLHRAWPEAKFRVVPDAGHAASEPGIVHELITATDRFRLFSRPQSKASQ
jgi:proline iminopeptidase